MNFNQRGFTLAGALALIAVMTILLAMAVPLWSRVKQRDNEEELIFRGKEYTEAIARYQQRFQSYPPDLETLEKLKFIRRLYADPMTKSGKWRVLHPDSLVQTGGAGQINQPGQPGQDSGDDDDDDDDDDDKGTKKKPFEFGSQEDQKTEDELKEGELKDEEPEVESTGPVVGVVSRSKKTSMKLYNGQNTYNKWVFTFSAPQEKKVKPAPKGGKPKQGDKNKNPAPKTEGNDDEEDEER
jgi:type II secretory pathway pseudopilin PulG